MIIKDPNYAHEYYGMSTDTKPLSVPNASLFYEIDTCDIYMFDEDGKQWFKQSGGSGSSGGSSGGGSSDSQGGSSASTANIMIIRPANVDRELIDTREDTETGAVSFQFHMQVTYDKTWQEVHDAMEADIPVYLDATDLALFKMEEEYFNRRYTGTDSPEPTVAEFETIKASTTVRAPITMAGREPNDPTVFYVDAFATIGDFILVATSVNAALIGEWDSNYRKPTDWPQDESGQG